MANESRNSLIHGHQLSGDVMKTQKKPYHRDGTMKQKKPDHRDGTTKQKKPDHRDGMKKQIACIFKNYFPHMAKQH